GEPLSAHATFEVERLHSHTAEFQITLPNGIMIQARETTEDMYSSIDLAGARIERQVRKWKDKIREHKPASGPSFSIRNRVIQRESFEAPALAEALADGAGKASGKIKSKDAKRKGRDGSKEAAKDSARDASKKARPVTSPQAPAIKVVREQTFTARPMRVDDAVMQLSLLESEFFVFLDVDTKAVSVVYRRKDGDYGLIETGGRLAARA
ncbi:MAG TPA: ribosome-associated translation inhibitor RaiA, partial [Polyangia bacterium]